MKQWIETSHAQKRTKDNYMKMMQDRKIAGPSKIS